MAARPAKIQLSGAVSLEQFCLKCVPCYTYAMQASEASGLPRAATTGSRAWGDVDLNSDE